MKFLKQLVKKYLLSEYEELHRLSGTPVWFDNFKNLTQAYEQRLNESTEPEKQIVPNETRCQLLTRLLGTPPSEAYYIVQALTQCKDLEGDICEFGVAHGETSALIANEIALAGNKIFHLFDSFEGLPKPSEKDKLKDDIFSLGRMEEYTGKMSCMEDFVIARLEKLSFQPERYVIHKGFFEEVIHQDDRLPEKVCFAYVDFDFYEPIKSVLEFLHQRTESGAVIIVDDYDFFSTGPKLAVDEFVAGKNLNVPLYECFVPDSRYGHFAVLTRKS
jgi:O-methyltransferase